MPIWEKLFSVVNIKGTVTIRPPDRVSVARREDEQVVVVVVRRVFLEGRVRIDRLSKPVEAVVGVLGRVAVGVSQFVVRLSGSSTDCNLRR